MNLNRRQFLMSTAGGVAAGPNTAALLSLGLGSNKFTAAAQHGSNFNGYSAPDFAETYGSESHPGWIVQYEEGKRSSVQSWLSSKEEATLKQEYPATNQFVIKAPPKLIGVSLLDQMRAKGLHARPYVRRVDLDVQVSLVEPVENPDTQGEFQGPGLLGGYDGSGLAFDPKKTTVGTARVNLGADKASVNYGVGTPEVRVGVIDTGFNTSNGEVFGDGSAGSPVTAPAAKSTVTEKEATVAYSRVEKTHNTDNDFNAAKTFNGLKVTGLDTDAYAELSLATYRSVTTGWTNGTLSQTTVNTADDLVLATDANGDYYSSGTYTSPWFSFVEVANFISNTINETLNSQSTKWEYRSSPDGTASNASAWNTDITAVPEDEYLQVRVTLSTSSTTATPEVHDYEVKSKLVRSRYRSQTRTLENVDIGRVDLSLTDASAIVRLYGYNSGAGTWDLVTEESYSSGGVHEFDVDPTLSYSDWEMEVVTEPSTNSPVGELHSETIADPESVDNANSDWSAVEDGNGHGTWCAAAVAADPSGTDYRGVGADAKVEFYPAKALDDEGNGSSTDVIDAIQWCKKQDVDIISMSLGTWTFSEAMADEIRAYLQNGGTAVVAAVGNDRQGTTWVSSPADVDEVIGVAATTNAAPSDAQSAYFSNVGPDNGRTDFSGGETQGAMPTVGAPGTNVEAKVPLASGTLTKRTYSGTSMSTPKIVGLLALLLTEHPNLKGRTEKVRELLEQAVVAVPKAGVTEVGHGMPDGEALVAKKETKWDQAKERTAQAKARDETHRSVSGSRIASFFGGDQ